MTKVRHAVYAALVGLAFVSFIAAIVIWEVAFLIFIGTIMAGCVFALSWIVVEIIAEES